MNCDSDLDSVCSGVTEVGRQQQIARSVSCGKLLNPLNSIAHHEVVARHSACTRRKNSQGPLFFLDFLNNHEPSGVRVRQHGRHLGVSLFLVIVLFLCSTPTPVYTVRLEQRNRLRSNRESSSISGGVCRTATSVWSREGSGSTRSSAQGSSAVSSPVTGRSPLLTWFVPLYFHK